MTNDKDFTFFKAGEHKWTQSDLAKMTGIRPNTISELYHELVERVNLDQLDLICEVLDCKLEELIVRVPNEEQRIQTIDNLPALKKT